MPSKAGSSTTSAAAAVAASASICASLSAGTSIRVGALQDWPTLRKAEATPKGTTRSKSASSSRIFGDLPPSSCVTRLTVGAAACATSTPARVEPVIEIMSMPGWAASVAPTSAPVPVTRLKTPDGVPASCMIWAKRCALKGDNSLGLRMTAQPAAMAGATLAVT